MKLQKLAFYLVILTVLITIISLSFGIPLWLKYFTMVLLLSLGGYYILLIYQLLISNKKMNELYSGLISFILLILTCTFLALFQSVRTDNILTILNILTVLNGIYPIFLILKFRYNDLVLKHFILAACLIGVGAFA